MGRPGRIVRRIGFELEDGSWFVWKTTGFDGEGDRYFHTMEDRRGVRPMRKHEPVHVGARIRVEADEFDENGMRLSDLEVLTHPVPLSRQGHSQLLSGLAEVGRFYGAVMPGRGHDHAQGHFLGWDVHRLTQRDVLLSGGAEGDQIRIQSTVGLRLTDLPLLYAAVGDAGSRWPAPRHFGPLCSAPRRARSLALRHLENTVGLHAQGDDEASLLGFLTAAIAFLRTLRTTPLIGGIKTYLPVMHRNDFATLFALLPASIRQVLRSNQEHVVEALIAGAFADPGRTGGVGDLAGYGHRPLVRSLCLTAHDVGTFGTGVPLPRTLALGRRGLVSLAYRPIPPALTIRHWIDAWLAEENPRDLLTSRHFEAACRSSGARPSSPIGVLSCCPELAEIAHLIDWNQSYEEPGRGLVLVFDWERLSSVQKEILRDSVRGIGGLGSATDGDDPELALFEIRAVSPRQVSIDSVGEAVSSHFSFLLRLLEHS